MLKITIIEDAISRSFVRRDNDQAKTLDKFPAKLGARVSQALAILAHNILSIEYDDTNVLFTGKTKNYSLASLSGTIRNDILSEILETIKLINWFLSPHFQPRDPDAIGGRLVCNDCYQSQPLLSTCNGRCKNPSCISHKMWAEVDESYTMNTPDSGKILSEF